MKFLFDKLKNHTLILASQSPRRQAFLTELHLPFEVRIQEVNENYPEHLYQHEITNYIAQKKANALKHTLKEKEILITSDTLVHCENKILGKPKNKLEAFDMLQNLSGKTHQVITSVCFTTNHYQNTLHDITQVTFIPLEDWQIEYYITHFQPFDKAGGYGIQEWIGAVGISKINGSYNNVVGLPTHLFFKELSRIITT